MAEKRGPARWSGPTLQRTEVSASTHRYVLRRAYLGGLNDTHEGVGRDA